MGKLENSVTDWPCWGRVNFVGSNMSPTKIDSDDARSVRWKIAYMLQILVVSLGIKHGLAELRKGKCYCILANGLMFPYSDGHETCQERKSLASLWCIWYIGVLDVPGFWKEWLKLPVWSWICPKPAMINCISDLLLRCTHSPPPSSKKIATTILSTVLYFGIIFVVVVDLSQTNNAGSWTRLQLCVAGGAAMFRRQTC